MSSTAIAPSAVRVRFAPSPTGYLHVGGARTLFLNWLFAKKTGGTLVLRIEDTDQERSTRQSEQMILSDIKQLGLDYDEGPGKEGCYGPYRQSERLFIYSKYAQKLLQEGAVYPCFCSDELLTEKRALALKMGKTPHYDGTCSRLSQEKVQEKISQGKRPSLRFKAFQKNYILPDHVKGSVEFQQNMVGDFLITRSSQDPKNPVGFPVYNFCCAIDDYLMNITHVIRAEEHLSNTVRQLMIYEALGWKPPEFAHISLVLGFDRQKLSKRSGDVSVHEYLRKGYLPDCLLNFLSLLGWWPPKSLTPSSGHPEILSRNEMIASFDLNDLQKSPAIFDIQKLQWMNSYYIKHLPIQEIIRFTKAFLQEEGTSTILRELSDIEFERVIHVLRSEATLISDLPNLIENFFNQDPDLELEAMEILKRDESQQVIKQFLSLLQGKVDHFSEEEIDSFPKKISTSLHLKGKALFLPMRVVVTGKTHGPELKAILLLLGRPKTIERIKKIQKKALS